MNDDLIILYYIVGFFIAVFITRAIFSIGTIVKNLKAQTMLLMKIAKAQGVDEQKVNDIALKTQLTSLDNL